MAEEQVFRFMALRQPTTQPETEDVKSKEVYYSVTGEEPELAQRLWSLPIEDRTPEKVKEMIQNFIGSA